MERVEVHKAAVSVVEDWSQEHQWSREDFIVVERPHCAELEHEAREAEDVVFQVELFFVGFNWSDLIAVYLEHFTQILFQFKIDVSFSCFSVLNFNKG